MSENRERIEISTSPSCGISSRERCVGGSGRAGVNGWEERPGRYILSGAKVLSLLLAFEK